MTRAIRAFILATIGAYVLLPGASVAGMSGAESGQAVAASPSPRVAAEVSGQLMPASDESVEAQKVLLVGVRVLDPETGTAIQELHPKGHATAIIDADVRSPLGVALTDATGRFTFQNVQAGRYSVAVSSSGAPGGVVLVQRPADSWAVLVFDVREGQSVDLGRVTVPKE